MPGAATKRHRLPHRTERDDHRSRSAVFDASQYGRCRNQHTGDVDRHAQRDRDDAYHQSPRRACKAPTFHIWSK